MVDPGAEPSACRGLRRGLRGAGVGREVADVIPATSATGAVGGRGGVSDGGGREEGSAGGAATGGGGRSDMMPR